MEWWKTFFDKNYIKLWETKLPEERTRREMLGIQAMLELPAGAQVLDLCCGHGRLTVPLAQAGWRMTGLDYSPHMLEAAQQYATTCDIEVEWQQGDMRAIPWQNRFDAVINIFTAFGYFEDESDDLQVLRSVYQALKPGGKFLIDTNHRDRVVRRFADRDWFKQEDGTPIWVERTYDLVTGRSHEVMHWYEDGHIWTRDFSVRVYSASEQTRLIHAAGLRPLAWYGDFDLNPLGMDTRLIILAEKRGE